MTQTSQVSGKASSKKSAKIRSTPEPISENFFPIVGIGASAGGLEAFSELLSELPPDTGMAFVYVQHLDPHHESLLASLLMKTTVMPVREAKDGMPVEPNTVYVIPPDANLGLMHGVLVLAPRVKSAEPHMSVDYFFHALAEDKCNQAIGVVLSGTASDGTLGLAAIKAKGGLTFAQQPESAKYDGMPSSAIAAEAVDRILAPKEIARELARVQMPRSLVGRMTLQREEQFPKEEDPLRRIFLALRMVTGVDFACYKTASTLRQITRRMTLGKIGTLEEYVKRLEETPSEVESLYYDLLINVTSFFRDQEVFEALVSSILPNLMKVSPMDAIRIWVPGCSSGEEAYSLAIILLEYLGENAAHVPKQIFATDIDERALEKARVGFYLESAIEGVSSERLQRFFTKTDGGYQVKKILREMCLFARHDILKDPPFSRLDIISCRNVLIYINSASQKKILSSFHYALNPNGVLVLGGSESVGNCVDLFSLIDKKNKIYKKKFSGHHILPMANVPPQAFVNSSLSTWVSSAATNDSEAEAKKEADRITLAQYAPASVLLDQNLDIIQFRGRVADYFSPLPGTASLNVLRMTSDGLAMELRNVITLAKKNKSIVERTFSHVLPDGKRRKILLEVTPLRARGEKDSYFLLTLEPVAKRVNGISPQSPQGGRLKPQSESRRIAQLQQDLIATKEYLQSTIEALETTNEELRSAFEEIQSSNEELQSVNEELETAKEELQATNEELTTVNEELHGRNTELNQVNNDLMNLLTSVNIPVLMLGDDLRIRRFTPIAEKMLNLIPSDVGRPLGDLRVNFLIPNLQAIIREVMDTLVSKEIELQDREGHWYSVRIRPYKTLDNKIDGVVIALLDVDVIKRSLLESQIARDYAQTIIETIQDPLLILDGDLKVHAANRSYYLFFQGKSEETEGKMLYEIAGGAWGAPMMRAAMDHLSNTAYNGVCEKNVEFEAVFPHIGRKCLLVSLTRAEQEMMKAPLILIAVKKVVSCEQESSIS